MPERRLSKVFQLAIKVANLKGWNTVKLKVIIFVYLQSFESIIGLFHLFVSVKINALLLK